MEKEKENRRPLSKRMTIFLVIMVAVYALAAYQGFGYIQRSLFYERSANMNLLMEKITQNVETGIQNRWNTLHALANEFVEMDMASLEDAEAALYQKKEHRHEAVNLMFFIDSTGNCYSDTGEGFLWNDLYLLGEQEKYVTISDDSPWASPDSQSQMYFIYRMPEKITVEGRTLTHLGLACDMHFVDPFFETEAYGRDSAAFIMKQDGTQAYRKSTDNPISGAYNVLSVMYTMTYHYGGSFDQLQQDIQSGTSGCMNLDYQGREYYLVYHPMSTNRWTSMLMIPADSVGSSSEIFVRSIILTIAAIALGGLTVLLVILLVTNRQVRRRREQVNLQLQRAVEAERNANNAKTKFLSSMSHDIRTPMNAIIGMTTLASNHLDDPEYMKNCLGKVALASNHLLTLINDVLDISKVESGHMTLNPIAFSLADTANNITNIVRPQITAKGQQFEMRVHNVQQEHLFADEMRINQIFINLLSNAVKYTPEGGRITVDIKQEPIFGASDRVRLIYVVEDNGIGMSKPFQRTMYDSFARAHGDQINTIQGTGLGLAICKQMVDLMDGIIECDSEEGKGTRFTVKLEVPIAEKLTDNLMLPPMKLLLVDDDQVFLETASETLKDLGLETDCVTSGEAAVQAVVAKHQIQKDYPVVIIDWQMPGMDGIQTTRAIREKVGPDVPIILISSYERSELEELALAAGANGFISKPFFKSTLYRNINEILGLMPKEAAAEPKERLKPLAGKHLLVAEDNDLNWEIAVAILEMHGMTAQRAVNGQECVDMLLEAQPGTFDFVLMDIQMPVMNGYEAAKRIRAAQRADVRNIPILAMTADAFADDVQRCVSVGMNGHVAKPIIIENLLNSLQRIGGG